jgi:hypothetical protein
MLLLEIQVLLSPLKFPFALSLKFPFNW